MTTASAGVQALHSVSFQYFLFLVRCIDEFLEMK